MKKKQISIEPDEIRGITEVKLNNILRGTGCKVKTNCLVLVSSDGRCEILTEHGFRCRDDLPKIINNKLKKLIGEV